MFNFTADILHVKELIRFWGNMEAKADAKGRVFLPAIFRKQLQNASEERLIMRKDVFQDCLVLYPESVWNTDLDELRKHLNPWNSQHQQIFRQYVSDVEIVILDSNGRILIPKRYLLVTDIQNDIRFVGMDNRIEMWAKEKTEQPFMDLKDFGNALQEVMKGENER
jgi:MraZ protein